MFTINPSRSYFLMDVNGKRDFNSIEKGANLVYRWFQNRHRHWSWGVLPWNRVETRFQPWAVYNSIPGRSVCHKGTKK
jgi:hypothetical protein